MGQFTMAWLVAPGMPVSNLAEFIAYVRARPGELNCASSNHSSRLATAQLFQQHKLEMTHVPYKGDAPAMLDLMANRVHVMVGALAGARAFLKDGKMKALMGATQLAQPCLSGRAHDARGGRKYKVLALVRHLRARGDAGCRRRSV